MGLRPGRCYRRFERPYTRQSQKKPRKGYVKGVPAHKIAQFEMGKKGNYDKTIYLVSDKDIQIRHNSLEAARVSMVQPLERAMGKDGSFFMKLLVYPHHVLRENALATGAGADRFQQGMRQSFGKPIGTAARVHKGQRIFQVCVQDVHFEMAKKAMKKGCYKLPVGFNIVVQ